MEFCKIKIIFLKIPVIVFLIAGSYSLFAYTPISKKFPDTLNKYYDLNYGHKTFVYLYDGSIINGILKKSEKQNHVTLKTSFGNILIEKNQIKTFLTKDKTEKLNDLINCMENQKKITAALKKYYKKYGKKGIDRINSWKKESKYLLILQIEHEFNRIPRCKEKFAQYILKNVQEGKIYCSAHGSADQVSLKIKKLLNNW
jgi:hypothetical protein